MTEIKEVTLPRDKRGNDPNDHRADTDYPRRVLASTSRVPGSTEKHDPALKIVPAALSEPIPQIRYIVDHIMPRQNVTMMGGHGGSGKSLLALVLAAHCASGRDWADLSVMQTRTLIVTLEDPPDLVRLRLRRIIAEYGLPADAIESAVTIADGTDGATLAIEAVESGSRYLRLTPVFDELRNLAAGHGLIIVDNASDAYGASENDRQLVRAFMAGLTHIAREHDAAVVLLAHIDKNSAKFGAAGNSYSGSTAWHNSARSRLALVGTENGALELRHEKANLGRKIDPIPLAWTDDGVLVPASSGRVDTHNRDRDDDVVVLAAIRAAIAGGTDVPAARTGPATTQHALCTYPELPKDLRTAAGRSRFWAAITRLQRSGKIIQDVITTPSRHKKTCWICAGSSADVTGMGEK
ncbi:MAG TPA: AAA family ATPase [Gammaproteobacteria bacterium]|nr:AAA family ATPase [Gammaproteobacteria bacterium]